MGILDQVEPKRVFHFFEEICQIPHGSGHTDQISAYLAAFAAERGLEHIRDRYNNIIIKKKASPTYESSRPVILQGHMDMVCEKAPDCRKDMEKEGLDLVLEGDTVYAKGTTLGADDGIAVAICLAILDDDTIPHPPLEVVLTVDEETGMLGAIGLDASPLKGRAMINLDSEDEGVFTVGCAGGADVLCQLPVVRKEAAGTALAIKVGGLVGGHSGAEINKGRANANTLLARILLHLAQKADWQLVSVAGGSKTNAIPREAEAIILTAEPDHVKAEAAAFEKLLRREFRVTDPELNAAVEETETTLLPLTEASRDAVLCFLTCLPNGVQAMSATMAGLVQTSLNMGIVRTTEEQISAQFLVRSSVDSQKRMVMERMACLTKQLGGSVAVSGDYPGWEYSPVSPLRDLFVAVYKEQYGRDPKVEAIHAGVECGMFASKLPGLDCISLGPTLTDIHTYRERLHIASIQRTWELLLEVLRRMHWKQEMFSPKKK